MKNEKIVVLIRIESKSADYKNLLYLTASAALYNSAYFRLLSWCASQ